MIAAVTLSLQLQRTSLDLLDGLNIEVAAHNSSALPVDVRFKAPAEYAIDVLRGDDVIWTSAPESKIPVAVPPHVKRLLPGPSVLAVYIWNEETTDGASVLAGDYTVRARLLGDGVEPQARVRVHFIAPTPVSALAALHVGDEVTIAGRYDGALATISDTSGSVQLTKKLIGAPSDAPIAVRGYVTVLADRSRVFFVSRWAKMLHS